MLFIFGYLSGVLLAAGVTEEDYYLFTVGVVGAITVILEAIGDLK